MRKYILAFLIIILPLSSAFAGGLSTTFGEVLVENVFLGKVCSLEKEAGAPLIVTNTSSKPVTLNIEVLAPQEEELKNGFEAIPDISWINIEREDWIIEPGESIETDLSIFVPDNEKYLGRNYQVYIWSHTIGSSVGVGLKSRLLFSVVKNKEKRL